MVTSLTPRDALDFEWCTFSPFRDADNNMNGSGELAVDALDFQPRLQDLDTVGLTDLLLTPTAKNNKQTKKRNSNTPTVESTPVLCFDKVRLVSPDFFTDAQVQDRTAAGNSNWREQFFELELSGNAADGDDNKYINKEIRDSVSSPLANMVHPMNLDLFIADTTPGTQRNKITRSESPAKKVQTMTILQDEEDKENNVHHYYANAKNDSSDQQYHYHKREDHIPDDASDAMSDVTMKSRSSVRSVSSAPAATQNKSNRRTLLGSNIFRMDRYRQGKKKKNKNKHMTGAGEETAAEAEHSAAGDNNSQRSFSSFLSSCSNNSRISYSLQSGRRGMSREERKQARELLRNQTIVATTTAAAESKSPSKQQQDPEEPYYCKEQEEKKEGEPVQTTTVAVVNKEEEKDIPPFIFVLLVEPAQKIFEVVKIDPSAAPDKSTPLHLGEGGLTVGDVLAQARTGATDPALASQKYVSLCNGMQELAAPMLPVDLLSRPVKDKGGDKHKDSERKKRRKFPEMLMAVPEGSTADVVRQIHSRLMQNPRMQRWWRQQDPFDSSSSKKKKESKKKSSRHRHKSSTTSTTTAPTSDRAVAV